MTAHREYLRIKLTLGDEPPLVPITQFTLTADNTIGDCRFFVNDDACDEADYWIVMETVSKHLPPVHVPRGRLWFVSAETAWPNDRYTASSPFLSYLDQFSRVYTSYACYLPQSHYAMPFLPWMINANHGSVFSEHTRDRRCLSAIETIPKTGDLSVICSNQTWRPDHRVRLEFVKALKRHFGETLDWFGNGVRPIPEKWDGIAPYRYHIALENRSSPNTVSEKLFDSFLGLSFPIYWGAPNVDQFFSPDSYTRLDINDLDAAIRVIKNAIDSDLAETHRDAILESRDRVLNEHNVFERIARMARKDSQLRGPSDRELISLQPLTRSRPSLRELRPFASAALDLYRNS